MDENATQPGYHAYILRCWQEADKWLFSLERIGVEKRVGFSDIDTLTEFLWNQVTLEPNKPKSE